MAEVSIILPVYNEASRLENAVQKTIATVSTITNSYEIIIAEDGSTDGTDKISQKLAETYPCVRHLHSDKRLGRGKALKNAFEVAESNIVAYFDADLSTDLSHLEELINSIRNGYDIATGSRLMKSSNATRPLNRDIASRGYNKLVRLLLRSKIHDHQCGFKAFNKARVVPLFDEIKDEHWFWDTELLLVAKRNGYKVYEFPVSWKHGGATKVKFKRDIVYMGSNILRVWTQISIVPLLIMATLAFAIIAIILLYSGINNAAQLLLNANLTIISIALLLYTTSWIVRGLRYEKLVGFIVNKKCGLNFMIGTVAISQTANLIVPARIGDLVRAYLLKKERQIPYSTGLSTLIAERVFDILAIFAFSVISLFFIISLTIPGWVIPSMLLMGCIIIGLLTILFLYRSKKIPYINKIMGEIKKISTSPCLFMVTMVLTAAIWSIDIATCYTVSLALGVEVPLMLVAFAVMVGNIVKIVPITPGGVGSYEAAVTAILMIVTLPAQAVVIALLDHLIKNLVTLLIGIIYLMVFGLKFSDVKIYGTYNQKG